MRVDIVPIESIVIGERFRKDYGDVSDLVLSFKKEGIIHPVAVMDMNDGTYTLLAGGRRMRAAKEGGVANIPIRIYPQTLSELEIKSIELMENVIRKDMTWLEQVQARKAIHELQIAIHGKKTSTTPDGPGWTQEKTAELLNITRGGVSQDITLADAAKAFPEVAEAKTKAEAAKILANIKEGIVKAELAKRFTAKNAAANIDKVHKDLISKYIVGDFFDMIAKLPNESMDIVEMDPPYGRDLCHKKAGFKQNWNDEYHEVEADDYLEFITACLTQVYRVMKRDTWLILWLDPYVWSRDIFEILLKVGFRKYSVNKIGIWSKGVGQTLAPGTQLANSFEMFFYAAKGDPIIIKQGRVNVFNYKPVPPQGKVHPAERPVELIQEILSVFGNEGSQVLVPFLGSGNTLLAAANLGMSGIGFDLSEEYKNSYTLRVVDNKPPFYKSYKDKE